MTIIATACLSGRYPYTAFTSVDDSGWVYGDTLSFPVAASATPITGELMLDITHDNTFAYSNLWIEMTYTDSLTSWRDTVNIRLATPDGHWLGHGLEGYYQLETPVKSPVILTDSSVICLRHIMRVDTLTGLSRIGLTLRTYDNASF